MNSEQIKYDLPPKEQMGKNKILFSRRNDLILSFAVTLYLGFCLLIRSTGISQAEISFFKLINLTVLELEPAVNYFMYLGTYQGLILILLTLLIVKKRNIFYRLLAGGSFALLSTYILKILIDRARPLAMVPDLILRTNEQFIFDYGFPSGHTALATAITVIIWPHLPKRFRPLIILFPLLMGLARMYVGVHLPLDVAGGLLLGLIIGYITRQTFGDLAIRK